LESGPSLNATEVTRAATMEEWLEGIPPVRHTRISRVSLGLLGFDLSR